MNFTRLFQASTLLTADQLKALDSVVGVVGRGWLRQLPKLAETTCGDEVLTEAGLTAERIASVAQPVVALYDEFSPFLATSHWLEQNLPNCAAEIIPEAKHLAVVFGEAWHDNWGHVPISEQEFLTLYQRYRTLLVPELILLAEVDGEPAGAWVAMPDFNVPIKAINGRLWPLGWWHLLRARHTVTRYRTMMTGVRPQFRRLGLPLIFVARCRAELARRRATVVEFSWILDDNVEVTTVLERLGATCVQTLRLYEKALA